jgi:hypothetical protein
MGDEIRWNKGMRVVKTFHGTEGYTETEEGRVGRIDRRLGIVYFDNGQEVETGITFDLSGRERENFFPPMWCEIRPAD